MNNDHREWLLIARSPPVLRRSAKVSVIVGTLLVTINQGDVLIAGFSADVLWKILLTYCVPFSVSTYAAVDAIVNRGLKNDAEPPS